MSDKPRLLMIADWGAPTGFARLTNNLLPFLSEVFEVSLCAINWFGDLHGTPPCPLFRAALGGDPYGVGRYRDLVSLLEPDAVFLMHDPWIVRAYLAQHAELPQWPQAERPAFVAYTAIDGLNVADAPALNAVDLLIAYTQFGATELRYGGYEGPLMIVPHGVDVDLYRPMGRREARTHLGVEHLSDRVVIGCLNRNQPRKRLDVLLMGFAQWVHEQQMEDQAYLWLHCANQDVGWNLRQLASYLHIGPQLILPPDELTPVRGAQESELPWLYSAWDLQVSTTLGEGWGLSTMEAMACGCPNLVPRWSALAEWAAGAVEYLPCSGPLAGIEHGNIGGLVLPETVAQALTALVPDAGRLEALRQAGLERVQQPVFRWAAIAERFITGIQMAVEGRAQEVDDVPRLEPQPVAI